jgi:5-methylthioribose kinase
MTLDIEDREALLHYLRATERVGPAESPRCRVLAGGVSNRTVWVERAEGPAWVLKQALPQLRVAVDWFSDPARIHREALGLRWLQQLAPAGSVPEFVFEDFTEHILAMQAVPQPHDNWKSLLLRGQLHDEHIEQLGRLLGTIHQRACLRRAELERAFADRSFFESLRLEPYYEFTAQRLPAASGFLQQLVAETRAIRATLVHGDFSPKNILVHDGSLVLLDHEVIHWGDPAFDVGFSLTHLLAKAFHLSDHRRAFTEAACRYWDTYREACGAVCQSAGLEERAVRHTLACLLARVAGRSPLEYLDAAEKDRLAQGVLALIQAAPSTVSELVTRFDAELNP